MPGAQMAGGANGRVVPDGQYTATIYGWLKDGKHIDAIKVLERELQVTAFMKSLG